MDFNKQAQNKLNSREFSEFDSNSKGNFFISNNLAETINIQIPLINDNKKESKRKAIKIKLDKKKNTKHKILNKKQNNILNYIQKMETMSGNKNNFNKINKDKIGLTRLLKNDEEIQDMEYEEAILYDKRTYIRMYWSFLLESQIILETFCTDNHLNLFVYR